MLTVVALAAAAPSVAAPQPFSFEFAPESRPCCYRLLGNDSNTPDDTPLMRGVTIPGAEITFDLLRRNKDEVVRTLGATTAGRDGRFRFQFPHLKDGLVRVRASVREAETLRTRRHLLVFAVDTVPPATPPAAFAIGRDLERPAPARVTTDASEVVFSFRYSRERGAGPVMLFRDGEPVRPQRRIAGWSTRVQLPENETHVYRVAHVDWAGNVGPFSEPITVTRKASRPAAAADSIDVKNLRRRRA